MNVGSDLVVDPLLALQNRSFVLHSLGCSSPGNLVKALSMLPADLFAPVVKDPRINMQVPSPEKFMSVYSLKVTHWDVLCPAA